MEKHTLADKINNNLKQLSLTPTEVDEIIAALNLAVAFEAFVFASWQRAHQQTLTGGLPPKSLRPQIRQRTSNPQRKRKIK
jgi:hypothetical protein